MSANCKIPDSVSSDKRLSRRLKLTGIIVLLLGVGGAGTVYILGTRSVNLSDDLTMVSYDKAQSRQMKILYGKSGGLIEDWSNDLKQPNTQAFIIASVSVIIASGCFYFAQLAGKEDKID